jgi:hypothetical protein
MNWRSHALAVMKGKGIVAEMLDRRAHITAWPLSSRRISVLDPKFMTFISCPFSDRDQGFSRRPVISYTGTMAPAGRPRSETASDQKNKQVEAEMIRKPGWGSPIVSN